MERATPMGPALASTVLFQDISSDRDANGVLTVSTAPLAHRHATKLAPPRLPLASVVCVGRPSVRLTAVCSVQGPLSNKDFPPSAAQDMGSALPVPPVLESAIVNQTGSAMTARSSAQRAIAARLSV